MQTHNHDGGESRVVPDLLVISRVKLLVYVLVYFSVYK